MRADLRADDRRASGNGPHPEPASGPRVGTYDEIAQQLTEGFWAFLGEGAGPHYGAATGGTVTVDITGLTADGQRLARWALEAWTDVTGIEFRFVSGNADITYQDHEPGAFGGAGIVNISTDLLESGTTIDSYTFGVYVHETGHALGLGHPGNYNATVDYDPVYETDAKFLNDSWQASVMSYFSQDANPYIDASYADPVTPMVADIIAIHDLYGVPAGSRAGNTVYGHGSNVGGYLGQLFAALSGEEPDPAVYGGGPVALTLYDTAGDDTLDLRWDAHDQRVDLRPEGISDVLGLTGNLVVARDTVIESFVAGSGNDQVTGNDAANRLEGRGGNDWLSGGSGADRLAGGAGDDRLDGGAGADAMDGGPGRDLLWYGSSDTGVAVDLSAGTAREGHAAGDTFENVEGVIGSAHADTLTGGAGNDWLSGRAGADVLAGGAGNDALVGGAGADAMDGGAGHDRLWYGGSPTGVAVDLAAGMASRGDAEGDTFENVEEVVGSAHADTLTGGAGNEWFSGRAGDDVIDGGAGNDVLVGGAGADAMDGGAGHDRLWYGGSPAGVAVDLSAGTASGGDAAGDTFENVEEVVGSAHADTLTGGSANDRLGGGAGDDVLAGGAGADRLAGGAGGDTVSYAGSNAGVRVQLRTGAPTGGHAQGDTLSSIEHLEGSAHADTFVGNGAANRLAGGAGADRLFGDWGDDTLAGGAGNDLLNGGGGVDTASYAGSNAGVRVHLGTGAGTGGHAQGDTLRGIEHLEGSTHPDALTGNDGANRLAGGAGADTLDGGAGNDRLSYAGSDTGVSVDLSTGTGRGGHAEGDTFSNVEGIIGSAHADTLRGGSGSDTLAGGAGGDVLDGGRGPDTLDGGAGEDDTLWYGESDAGVRVDLSTGIGRGGHAEGDTFSNVEGIVGSAHADRLTGGAANDWLEGGTGNDTLAGGAGNDDLDGGPGADSLDGGSGVDTLWYFRSDAGVTVDLSTGTASGGHATGDTFSNVEWVYGSAHADQLTGSAAADWLLGNAGDDTLDGGAGNDELSGDAGNDVLTGGAGDDLFRFDRGLSNGQDIIRDFADGPAPDGEQDLIELFGDFTFDALVLTISGNDVIIAADNATDSLHVTLENYLVDHKLGDLTAEDFLFLG